MKVSTVSALTGIPGGMAVFGSVPTSLVQYYWHTLVVAQKLGYLYGWADLLGEDKSITEGTKNVLTVFVGVMMGAQAANNVVREMVKSTTVQMTKNISKNVLISSLYYPIAKQISKYIGIKITQVAFAKGFSTLVPILGGVTSGVLTYTAFKPMAIKLRCHLRQEMLEMSNFISSKENDSYLTLDETPVNALEEMEQHIEYLRLQAMINIAKIDFGLHHDEIELITKMINNSSLNNDLKMNLLNNLHSKEIIDIDFSVIKKDKRLSLGVLEDLLAVINIDGIKKDSENIYFNKVAIDLGFTIEEAKNIFERENFIEYKNLTESEIEYLCEFNACLIDGKVNIKERRLLNRIASLLNISEDRALEIECNFMINREI